MNKFRKSNIPNMLTILRVMLVVPIAFFLLFNIGDNVLYSFNIGTEKSSISIYTFIAGILFSITAITDALDGYLARKYKWITNFGKIWDPIADKVIINSISIIMAIRLDIPIYIPLLLIIRDTIIDGYRMMAIINGKDVSANVFGKIKTILLFIGIINITFIFNFDNDLLWPNIWQYYILQNGIIIIAAFISIFSGFLYIKEFHKK